MLRFYRDQEIAFVTVGLAKANGAVTGNELKNIFGCSISNIGNAIRPLVSAGILNYQRGSSAKITLLYDDVTFLDVLVAIQGPIQLGYGLKTNFYMALYETASIALADFLNRPIPAIETLEEVEND